MTNTNDWAEALARRCEDFYSLLQSEELESALEGRRGQRGRTAQLYEVARGIRRDLENRYLPRLMNREAREILKEIVQEVLLPIEDCFNPEHHRRLMSELNESARRHARVGEYDRVRWKREDDLRTEEFSAIRAKAQKELEERCVVAKATLERGLELYRKLVEFSGRAAGVPAEAPRDGRDGRSARRDAWLQVCREQLPRLAKRCELPTQATPAARELRKQMRKRGMSFELPEVDTIARTLRNELGAEYADALQLQQSESTAVSQSHNQSH